MTDRVQIFALAFGQRIAVTLDADCQAHFVGGEVGRGVPLLVEWCPAGRDTAEDEALRGEMASLKSRLHDAGYCNVQTIRVRRLPSTP
jgi:hypothetical protein